jgi:general secretion pathway protein I
MAGRDWFWSMQSQSTEVPDFSRVEVQVRDSEAADAASLYTLVAFLAAVPNRLGC